ncbi:DUF4437 domain-containing protein [Pontiella sp.]|uniref:DUF4437 domain-containing protein n=1 Tax=Pontiella sp. TaxID=2837462 RepID=UPI0035688B16
MNTKTALPIALLAAACAAPAEMKTPPPDRQNIRIVLNSEVEWTHLNPKRGDLAPKAGTLWGDRNGTEPTGFLLKPPPNFESPPHIHNISYRGVVIQGVLHNDDPDAADLWMPAGSFWTQPKGHVHITAAQGTDAIAYIEIEEGPYLVLPQEEAFDSEERPVNVDHTNLVWLNASDIVWIQQAGVQVAVLWGNTEDGRLNGSFIKLPAGFDGTITSEGPSFRGVVIKGELNHQAKSGRVLEPGSLFSSKGTAAHRIASSRHGETVIYVRTDGKYTVASE